MGNPPTTQHIANLVPQVSRPWARAGMHARAQAAEKGAIVFEDKGFSHNPVILMFRPSGRKAPHATAPTVSRASTTRRQTSPRRPDGGRIAASDCRDQRPR
jgi:hypothetical protein